MPEGPTVILRSNRGHAHRLVDAAPAGSVMTITPPRRTLPQNARLHAVLTEIMLAKPEGRNYPLPVWRGLVMAMAGHKVRFEPALDGEGMVPLGFRTSRLSKAEFSELIDAAEAYGAMHGVVFKGE